MKRRDSKLAPDGDGARLFVSFIFSMARLLRKLRVLPKCLVITWLTNEKTEKWPRRAANAGFPLEHLR